MYKSSLLLRKRRVEKRGGRNIWLRIRELEAHNEGSVGRYLCHERDESEEIVPQLFGVSVRTGDHLSPHCFM